jgi:hypothetical protein
MTTELDHMFICTKVGAPEANQLAALSLAKGRFNAHLPAASGSKARY